MSLSIINQEEHDFLQQCEVIVVIGLPATGKSFTADWIQEVPCRGHSLFSSDDYIDFGYEESLYAMIRTKAFKVDAIVITECSPETRAKRYAARDKGQIPTGFDRNLETVFKDYLAKMAASGQELPRIINVKT
jgi:dephospho-CoA kinase